MRIRPATLADAQRLAARRSDEREGWRTAGAPFVPPDLGLEPAEYRLRLERPAGAVTAAETSDQRVG